MNKPPLSAPRAWVRQPVLQDTVLAAGLLAVCLAVNNPVAAVRAVAADPLGGAVSGTAVVWEWWTATVVALAGVALRRRWPLPLLGVCALAVAVHLGLLFVVPTVVDLSSVVLLATVAARCPRRVSLAALAGMLALVAGWCLLGARVGHLVNGLPTFNVEVVHHVAPSQRIAGDSGGDSGGDRIIEQAQSSNTWSALALLGSVLVAAWAVGSSARSRREYLHQLHARAADLERERDQRAALAVAAERGRISREMHDVVAHGLSLIVIQAQGADAALANRPADTRAALRTIVKTGRDSLADMRRVLAALGEVEDAWHPQPGLAQLPALLDRVRRAGTAVELRVRGTPAALPSAVELSAYRVVQEALTNVMKHAGTGATTEVVVDYTDAELGVEVSDNGPPGHGHGDETTTALSGGRPSNALGGGNGLRGMDRRVHLLGGELSAGPRPGGGFRVRVRLPIEERRS